MVVEPALAVADQVEGKKLLVLMDALDECEATGRVKLLETLAKEWPRMPPSFGLVVSTRPDVNVPTTGKFRPMVLEPNDAANQADVKAFLESKLPVEVAAVVAERADGLFLYARFAVERLVKTGRAVTVKDAEALPPGLDGMYVDYFSRLREELGVDAYVNALAPVVAARVADSRGGVEVGDGVGGWLVLLLWRGVE